VPIIGDFHYIGHKLLTDHPACAEALAKYRINPGNVGFRAKRDTDVTRVHLLSRSPVEDDGNERDPEGREDQANRFVQSGFAKWAKDGVNA